MEISRQPAESLPKEKATLNEEGEARCGEQPEDCVTDNLSLVCRHRGDGSAEAPESRVQKSRRRCYGCNKKVGLTALQCKCGLVFCALHRYPDEHDCTFDFKGHDRKSLAKQLVGGGQFEKVALI